MLRLGICSVFATALLLAGCTSIEYAHDWWITDPLDKAFHKQRKTLFKNHRATAKAAWQEFIAANPECNASVDFRHGFIDGFADHMNLGGIGEPPYLPPRNYRTGRYESPAGQAAIRDWFCGFRVGASEAISCRLGPEPIVYPGPGCAPLGRAELMGQPTSEGEVILVQPDVHFDG